MAVSDASRQKSIIETIRNYAVLDDRTIISEGPVSDSIYFESDRNFWQQVISHPDSLWNKKVTIQFAVMSDWVARIPGLYWLNESDAFRNVPESQVEFRSPHWVAYTPPGKSSKVMGGIGTFLLPPDDNGKTIVTLSPACNASTGIPALMSPEVLEHHQIKQGDLLTVTGVWRKMSLEWAGKFPKDTTIPRGYLVVDQPSKVEVNNRKQPIEFHPCTIMEYSSDQGMLYDFVFCTADSFREDHRKDLESFFERYRKERGRDGQYLISADSTQPLFEALYHSPAELLRAEPGGRSQLNLIIDRIKGEFNYKGETIETLITKIPKFYPTSQEIAALAVQLGIRQQDLETSSAIKMAAQLVELCKAEKKLELLADQLQSNH